MPVKNAEPWLEECLDSIINQSYSNWELIAVDDCSSDQSFKLLSRYSKEDSRIRCFNNNHSGIIHALQKAFDNSSGSYISRMDADDIMPIDKLENLYKIASSDEKIIATGEVKYFSSSVISDGYLKYELWLNERSRKGDHWEHVYRECAIASGNWMVNRKSLLQIVPFSDHIYPEDYDLIFRLKQNGCSVRSANKVTHLWREHSMRTSRTSEDYSQRSFFSLKLNWFLKSEYLPSSNIVLFGKNQKEKLCKEFFANHSIPTTTLQLPDYSKIETLNNVLTLVCVYPEKRDRIKLEGYLNQRVHSQNLSWWYV